MGSKQQAPVVGYFAWQGSKGTQMQDIYGLNRMQMRDRQILVSTLGLFYSVDMTAAIVVAISSLNLTHLI